MILKMPKYSTQGAKYSTYGNENAQIYYLGAKYSTYGTENAQIYYLRG